MSRKYVPDTATGERFAQLGDSMGTAFSSVAGSASTALSALASAFSTEPPYEVEAKRLAEDMAAEGYDAVARNNVWVRNENDRTAVATLDEHGAREPITEYDLVTIRQQQEGSDD